jgi:signal transduction histidine kinase
VKDASVPTTPLEAVRRPRFLLSAWPWRSAAYTATTSMVAGVVFWPLLLAAFPLFMLLVLVAETRAGNATLGVGAAVALAVFGSVLLGLTAPLLAMPVAAMERWRVRLVTTTPVVHGHRPPPPGLWAWMRTRYTEPATWRETVYLLLLVLVLGPVSLGLLWAGGVGGVMMSSAPAVVAADGGPLALGTLQLHEPVATLPYAAAGLLLLLCTAYLLALLAGVHARLARVLLGRWDTDRLQKELVEVTRSRARLVDAFEAERHRIERDLHDGAQQRLVALAMQLGLARMDVPGDTAAGRALAGAHEQAKELISEMRELIHGIHPQLLTDRGLTAALQELADRCAMAATVNADLPHRFPAHVEATAYFVVAEALTNAAKHAEAGLVWVAAKLEGALLVVEVEDDGQGGADPDSGTGLTGLADRVSVMDGRLLVSSPPGGPTRIRVELPGASAAVE